MIKNFAADDRAPFGVEGGHPPGILLYLGRIDPLVVLGLDGQTQKRQKLVDHRNIGAVGNDALHREDGESGLWMPRRVPA